MKVLTIGCDKDLLKPESVSAKRHIAYARELGELHTVVFARKAFGKEVVELSENVHVYPTYSTGVLGLFLDAYRIGKRILQEEGEEWVISAQDPFEAGLVGYLLARTTRTPLLLQEHGDFFSLPYWRRESVMNRVRYIVGKWLLPRADHVRAVSARIARTVVALGVQKENITITPVHINVDMFAHAEHDDAISALRTEGGVLILSMARFVPQKNLTLLLKAFRRAQEKGMRARLVLVGCGPEEEALRTYAKHFLPDAVTFLDWTEDPASAIASADIYALSSDYEGWGRVCIETLATGTPLVMTDVGCAGEVVRDGVNGLVVPVRDEEALTEALYRLAKDEALRTRLAEAGKDTIAHMETIADSVALYKKSLERCIVSGHAEKDK